MSRTLPISEVKARLPELVTGVAEREEEIVVTRNGRPAAVLVNYVSPEARSDEMLVDESATTTVRESRINSRRRRHTHGFDYRRKVPSNWSIDRTARPTHSRAATRR